MADAPKKSKGKAPAKAAPKGTAKAVAKVDTPKPKAKSKPKPTLTELRNRWRDAQEVTAYRERRVARADASQSSEMDRIERTAKAKASLQKARDAEEKARERFVRAQREAQR